MNLVINSEIVGRHGFPDYLPSIVDDVKPSSLLIVGYNNVAINAVVSCLPSGTAVSGIVCDSYFGHEWAKSYSAKIGGRFLYVADRLNVLNVDTNMLHGGVGNSLAQEYEIVSYVWGCQTKYYTFVLPECWHMVRWNAIDTAVSGE